MNDRISNRMKIDKLTSGNGPAPKGSVTVTVSQQITYPFSVAMAAYVLNNSASASICRLFEKGCFGSSTRRSRRPMPAPMLASPKASIRAFIRNLRRPQFRRPSGPLSRP